jgi:formate dehydrogenase maturation protein FdhE
MTLAEKLLQEFQKLPEDKQRQTIDFVEFLRNKEQKKLEDMMDAVIDDNKEAFLELAK